MLLRVTLAPREMAFVALSSEREVMVQTLLAGPVSCSFNHHLFAVQAQLVVNCLKGFLLLLLSIHLLCHMLWFTLEVFWGLSLLTSEALLSTFEVVVLALFTLPSTVWEVKIWLLADLRFFSRLGGWLLEWLVDGSYWVLVASVLCLLVCSKVVNRDIVDRVIPLLVKERCWLHRRDVRLIWKYRIFKIRTGSLSHGLCLRHLRIPHLKATKIVALVWHVLMLLWCSKLLEVSWLSWTLHIVSRILDSDRLLDFHIFLKALTILDWSGKQRIAKCLRNVVGALFGCLDEFGLSLFLDIEHFLCLQKFS